MFRSLVYQIFLTILVILATGCGSNPGSDVKQTGNLPVIQPDYSGITIPENIAPLNFKIREKGSVYLVKISSGNNPGIRIRSKDGVITIPQRKWKELLQSAKDKELNIDVFIKDEEEGWKKYETIKNYISSESIDPYLTYRLIHPGYERWNEISIQQRSIQDFKNWPVIENSVADRNCVNCHSYNNGKSDDFLFHMRGSLGGTYFYSGGELRKTNLKTPEMSNGSVYPRWHPSGKFVAFSSNKIVQQFHTADNNKIEVSDLESSIVLYDIDKNEIIPVELPDKDKFMDTYPEWSPDGKMMYFCRAPRLAEDYDYRQTRYDLYRIAFDPGSRKFGNAELVFDAAGMNKSIAFPRVSPEGNYLVMTIQDYGCFPIWHKETDLISLNLKTFETERLELNSDYSESYHSWSSNGKWLLFASRRDDGLTTRPYIAYINKDGKSGKPFIVPQKDPEFYDSFLKSFNVPEFSNVKIAMNPGKIRDAVKSEAVQAKWAGK
ncbi:MAG TPA: hypothetical protein PKM76_13265 [Bacteroidales bacterium]|nr:hypothetical protein [Bacteroidales bacterium]